MIGGGAGAAPTVGTRSGNTTAYVTTTGTQTSGDCVKIDANGNHVANGSACGSGGGTLDGARVSRGAQQTISNNTVTSLAFDTETYDNGSMHSTVTNNSRLTAATTGYYIITGGVSWTANAVGIRQLTVFLNGTTTIQSTYVTATAALGVDQNISTLYKLTAGDYVELQVYQNSGGNLDVSRSSDYSPIFSAQLITQ